MTGFKDHICRCDDCYRSFHTERGREIHEERIHGGLTA